jgi:hypothetical protein
VRLRRGTGLVNITVCQAGLYGLRTTRTGRKKTPPGELSPGGVLDVAALRLVERAVAVVRLVQFGRGEDHEVAVAAAKRGVDHRHHIGGAEWVVQCVHR